MMSENGDLWVEERMKIRGECLTLAHSLYKKLKKGDVHVGAIIACEEIITLTIGEMKSLTYLQWCKNNDVSPPDWKAILVFKGSGEE